MENMMKGSDLGHTDKRDKGTVIGSWGQLDDPLKDMVTYLPHMTEFLFSDCPHFCCCGKCRDKNPLKEARIYLAYSPRLEFPVGESGKDL